MKLALIISDDAKKSVHLVAGECLEAYLPLADMVDISAEVQRLSKRLSKMQSEYDALAARLSSSKVNFLLLLETCNTFFHMLAHIFAYIVFTTLHRCYRYTVYDKVKNMRGIYIISNKDIV